MAARFPPVGKAAGCAGPMGMPMLDEPGVLPRTAVPRQARNSAALRLTPDEWAMLAGSCAWPAVMWSTSLCRRLDIPDLATEYRPGAPGPMTCHTAAYQHAASSTS